ncbi:MAG: dihydroorotate dehydrogenase (quinone) [Chloroflexi bacterium]|nr:dihydroorotate dehydrogenase (quinone) [Chloroflexota bacterium]
MSIGQILYQLLVRPALFTLPPERGQRVAEAVLTRSFIWRAIESYIAKPDSVLQTDLCGLKLSSPVGLAAGFDKDCRMLQSLSRLGFGYLVGGTVVAHPQLGNAKPRMVRRIRERALVNSLGFPSKGLDAVAAAIEHRRDMPATPLVMSVAGVTIEQAVTCHRKLEPLSDAIEVNISSPNTAGLRLFQEPEELRKLLDALNEERYRPLFVKLPRYPAGEENALEKTLELTRVCVDTGMNGVTVANTRPVEDARLAIGRGGLSGQPLLEETVRLVEVVRKEVGEKLAINACGGISTGDDAWAVLQAGATTVQLYTVMIYRGPLVVRDINRRLAELKKAASS